MTTINPVTWKDGQIWVKGGKWVDQVNPIEFFLTGLYLMTSTHVQACEEVIYATGDY